MKMFKCYEVFGPFNDIDCYVFPVDLDNTPAFWKNAGWGFSCLCDCVERAVDEMESDQEVVIKVKDYSEEQLRKIIEGDDE
jgi:hypothetical protein